mmetsp:Transcript_15138/g.36638  ORF Transcript_15138/g.36638 Transcript_15138/m.36638 type:complete len:379 (+) Transcript_15138:485-1621(+)
MYPLTVVASKPSGCPSSMSTCGPIWMRRSSCSKGTPAYPAAHARRPQLGSCPKTADLTREEDTMERAMTRASSSLPAPNTFTSMRQVAPSPSHAMDLAMATHTAPSAASSAAASDDPSTISSPPAAPDARPMTLSLVEVSPSTEIWLKEPWLARFIILRQASEDTGASHVTTPSMVAMLGWIMPDPLPMPPILYTRPGLTSTSTAMVLRTRSVVQMAVAHAIAASLELLRLAASTGMALSSSVILMRLPITPVDSSSTSSAPKPSVVATAFADAMASSMPSLPVAALACPALMSTARDVVFLLMTSRQYITGAAATRFSVNTPAVTAGASATTSAQSARTPLARRPALNAAALNPLGAQMPPSMDFQGPAGRRPSMGA